MRKDLAATRFALAAALAGALALPANAGSSPAGVWMDHTGRGAVEIKPCGSALCGHVVWVKNANDSKGCGRQIIGDARASGGGAHEGWIYSPEDKKRFNVEITPLRDGRLRVVGYKGIKLFSRTMMWTRADANLTRCGTESAATPAKPNPDAKTAAAAPEPKAATPAPEANTESKQQNPATTAAVTKPERDSPKAPEPARDKPSAPPQAASDTGEATTGNSDETADETAGAESTPGSADGGKIDLGKIDLDELGLDKFLKRTAGGNCKLDLPWVKVEFGCARE